MLLLAAGFTLPAALALEHPEYIVDLINEELEDGVEDIEDEVSDYQETLDETSSQGVANAERLEAIEEVKDVEKDARTTINLISAGYHSNPSVQAAFTNAMVQLVQTKAAALNQIEEMYESWIAANTTTTTVPPTPPPPPATTTTTPATTTTTTTTTLPAAVLLPDLPDKPESSFMATAPDVVVSTQSESPDISAEGATATVGFMSRVVDSRLPAVVSAVAVGPLVVLGLVLDAIRSAGIFMVVPWILLMGYMVTLLMTNREWLPRRAH